MSLGPFSEPQQLTCGKGTVSLGFQLSGYYGNYHWSPVCFESKQICFGIISGRGDIAEGNDGRRCFGKKRVSPEFLCPFLTISVMLGLFSPRDGQETESETSSEDTSQKPGHEPPEQGLRAMMGRRTPNLKQNPPPPA